MDMTSSGMAPEVARGHALRRMGGERVFLRLEAGYAVYEVDDGEVLVSPKGKVVAFNCVGHDTTYHVKLTPNDRKAFQGFTWADPEDSWPECLVTSLA